jgi:hypothetical protein
MRALTLSCLLTLTVVSCKKKEEEVKPKEDGPPPGCEIVNYDSFVGKTFVLQTADAEGKETVEELRARLTFMKEGAVTKAKYSAKHPSDVYTYTCTPGEKDLTCWEDNPRLGDFCRTLFANGKECNAEELVKMTGCTPEDAAKTVTAFQEELKKLPPKEVEDMKKVFNSPNNQLRGLLRAKIPKGKCYLTVSDRYQTMTFGAVREMDNVVGSAHFFPSQKDLIFEHCQENKNLVALATPDAKAKPGESVTEWAVGAKIPFRFVGEAAAKPEGDCTYLQDQYAVYEPLQKGVPVAAGPDGNLAWGFDHGFTAPGKYVVHLNRYKACKGGAPEKIDTICQYVAVK